MPSPFPGMDPYLEERARWPDVHQRLIAYISEALQPQLRPKYVARIGERIQLADVRRSTIPDALLVRTLREPAPTLAGGAAADADVPAADEPQTITIVDEERRVPYVEIVYRETEDVVTLIEGLGPANKEGEGRERYLQKQADLLHTDVNLVEIDLLGYGQDTVLACTVPITDPPDWRYLISISRGERRDELQVYAVLDLPAVFTRCYDVGGYDLLVDYGQPPDTPLSAEEREWLRERLQGVRAGATGE